MQATAGPDGDWGPGHVQGLFLEPFWAALGGPKGSKRFPNGSQLRAKWGQKVATTIVSEFDVDLLMIYKFIKYNLNLYDKAYDAL